MRALITGGAVRLGSYIATSLAENGYDLIIHYNKSETEVQKLLPTLQNFGIKAYAIKADLNNINEAQELIKKINKEFGNIDILVNNASPFIHDDIDNFDTKIFDLHMNVILKSPIILTKEFSKQTKHGVVINIIDQKINKPDNRFMSYSLAKVALHSFTQIAAKELAPSTRVNGVSPGLTLVGINQSKESFNNMQKNTLLQKKANPQDVAKAVLFLIKNESITGEIIKVDCGMNLK